MTWVFVWVLSAFIGAAAGGRNNAAGTGFLLGIVLGPVGAIAAFGLRGNRRKCPFCKELVVKSAAKCPKCQSELPPGWGESEVARNLLSDLVRAPRAGPGFIFARLTSLQQIVAILGALYLVAWILRTLGVGQG